MKSPISVGIDIGTNTTKAVVIEHGKDGAFHILGASSVTTRGIKQGYVTNSEDIEKTIETLKQDLARKTGLPIKHAIISIGGISLESILAQGGSVISRADNEITELDIEKSITEALGSLNTANKKVIHEVPVEYRIDGDPIYGNPVGMKGVRLDTRTLFITTLEQHYNNILEAMSSSGITVTDVIASPLAISLSVLSERQRNAGCALIDIGEDVTIVSIFEDGNIVILKSFPFGANNVTNDIALGLQVPLEDAELLKTGHIVGSFPKKKIDEIVDARTSEMFTSIQKFLKKIGRHQLLPAGAILVGGGSQTSNIELIAKRILKIPVRIAEARSILPHKAMRQDPLWFVALGLCVADRFNQKASGNRILPELPAFFDPVKRLFSELFKQFMP